MIKLKLNGDMYSINDVKVTGSHGMKYKDKWIFIKENKTIGDTIYFISTINYPKNIEIIQPDSSNDYKTFELIGRGDLEGIFQLESSGMKQVVKDFKPNSLEDISSILALYRPGPLDAGLIPKFINRKNGKFSKSENENIPENFQNF